MATLGELAVVLGLCGQINLAQAAFFGFGAYAVGLGTSDLHISFWLALAIGAGVALVMGVANARGETGSGQSPAEDPLFTNEIETANAENVQ